MLSTLLPIPLINSAVQPNRSIPGSPEETEAWDCTSAISCLSGPWSLITSNNVGLTIVGTADSQGACGKLRPEISKYVLEVAVFKYSRSQQKTTGTFADGHLTDAFKNIANDPNADKRVKKKLILVLASWRDQFSSDPSMTLVAGLYKQCRGDSNRMAQQGLTDTIGMPLIAEDTRRIEKEAMRKKAKQEKAVKAQERQKKRTPFEFEKVFSLESIL